MKNIMYVVRVIDMIIAVTDSYNKAIIFATSGVADELAKNKIGAVIDENGNRVDRVNIEIVKMPVNQLEKGGEVVWSKTYEYDYNTNWEDCPPIKEKIDRII